MTPDNKAALDALNKILRGMRARNEEGSLELTNWIADNQSIFTTHAANTGELKYALDVIEHEVIKEADSYLKNRPEATPGFAQVIVDSWKMIKAALQRPEPSECQTCHGKGGWEESACGEGCCRSGVKCEDCNGTGSIALAPRQVDVEGLSSEIIKEFEECMFPACDATVRRTMHYLAQHNLLAAAPTQDLSKCPGCGGPADNGHDRCFPPSPYFCTKCETQDTKGE